LRQRKLAVGFVSQSDQILDGRIGRSGSRSFQDLYGQIYQGLRDHIAFRG
jgi:hypothetical protein